MLETKSGFTRPQEREKERLEYRFSFSFSVNEFNSLACCDHREIVLEFPYFKRRTVINLYNTVIGEFFMFYKLSFSVFFDHFPDFVHPTRGNIISADGKLMASSLPEYKIYT